MTIRMRSYSILAVIAVLMLGMAAGSVLALRSARTLVDRLYDNALLPSLDLKTVSDGYIKAGVVMAVRVRTGDLPWEEGASAVRRLRALLTPAWADYVRRAEAPAERELIGEAEARTAEAEAALDELLDILDGQDVAGLATYIARVSYPSLNPLMAVIERMSEQQDRTGRAIFAASNAVIRQQEWELGIVLSVAALAFLVAFSTVRQRVIKPLAGMTRAMTAVAGGDLDHEVPSTDRRDEIGALALALDRFRDNARQLKRMTVDLAEARDTAEEATRAKSAFLAMMSHEIRTPMNGVMSMAELLDQSELTAGQRTMSSVIRQSAGALLTIINDILDFSKIEAGRLDIERVGFSLVEVVEGTAELVSGRADERGLDLVVDLDPALPDRLEGDPTRVRQVLLNLLGNAVKFTESGSVTLSVGRGSNGTSGDTIRFAVTDTGIGLTPHQQARLFQAFVQADASTARKYGGTGLGLSISQRLCQMMGGEIAVTSMAGQGSTFWFELPLPALDPAPAAPDIAIADARVLVAAGLPAAQATVLTGLLAAAGIAGEAEEPAVILVHAGDRAALDRTGDFAPSARVILLASRALIASLSAAEQGRCFATLTMPLRRHLLWHTIAAAMGRASLTRQQSGDGPSAWLPPGEDEARAAKALVLVAEDNATNQVVIDQLLTRLGYAHRIAGNGAQALAMLDEDGGGYGLLLTDFHMPEMDGFQLTAAVRAAEGNDRAAEDGGRPRLPIIALTADALPGTEQRCLAAGMDGYLTKPIDTRALARALEHWLPQAAALRRPPEPAPEAPAPTVPAPLVLAIDRQIFDPERLRESFGEFGDTARAFLTSFLGDVPGMIAAINDALESGDHSQARDAAHTLKGAAGSIGAARLHQLAADVQDCLDARDVDTAKLMASLLPPTCDELVTATAPLR
jgi:signal transduction histidine kinase/DNA-binding response OmpR family regulator/HPt (histidine-containing phosphotransfer) domain-containing protein